MDVHEALAEVARWCARETAAGDPDVVEVEGHATVFITIGEASPPWHVRWERRRSAGASAPVAQLRVDLERRDWALHYGAAPDGWCSHEDAIHARELGPLLDVIASDRTARFAGLPPGYSWD
jgi:Protein of unknown function (DUF3024)